MRANDLKFEQKQTRTLGGFDVTVLDVDRRDIEEANLKPTTLATLQQAKQNLEQERAAEIAAWEQDFRANTTRLAGQQLKKRFEPVPVARPGERHSALKARINNLNQAIQKKQYLDNVLRAKAEKAGILNEPGIKNDFDTSMYIVMDGPTDDYVTLNQHLDTAIKNIKTRLAEKEAAYAKPSRDRMVKEFSPPDSNGGDGENERSRRLRQLLKIAIKVGKEKNVDELGMIHAMNMIAGDDFYSLAVEGLLPDITGNERMYVLQTAYKTIKQGLAEGSVTPDVTVNKVHDDGHEKEWHIYRGKEMIGYVTKNQPDTAEGLYIAYGHGPGRAFVEEFTGLKPAVNYIASLKEGVVEGEKKGLYYYVNKRKAAGTSRDADNPKAPTAQAWKDAAKTAKTEGVEEAIKLNAPQRKIPRDELQGYADRVKTGTKTKRDKFAPIIHGSNIKAIVKDENNTEWDLDDLAKQITTRPRAILGTNAKMEKSATEGEIVYDLTLPALSGIVVDEETGDFVEITTCPGAGACQLFCYARKGGYVMFPASSMSAAQALNFLVNDPEGYSARVNQEIQSVKKKADKHSIQLVVRWHDAGDFFSKDYLDLAFDVARANPDVEFYAYTKIADVATASKPNNFIINFSSGSKRGEEKKVEFHKSAGNVVKQGVTIPKDMFFDLIAREGVKLIKDAKGRTQFKDHDALNEFKRRLASKYNVNPATIITYDQMLATPVGTTPTWNVIVQPGAGDRAANRKDVIDSYLMFH